MLKFYYTGAKEPNIIQDDPKLSLGCYKSNTQVPNDLIGNFFGDLSPLTIERNKATHILLALVSTEGASNVKMHFSYPKNSNTKLSVGAIEPSQDSDGNFIFEEIGTINEKPIGIDFYEADGSTNQIELTNSLGVFDILGVWIRRELAPDIAKGFTNEEIQNGANEEKEENVDIVLQWDSVS